MVYFFLLSGLFIGWSMGANDTGNIFGAAVSTRMIKFRKAALIASIFYTLGAFLEGSGPSSTLGRLGTVDAIGGAFTVALAAALAIVAIVRLGIPVSVSQTIVGAIIGWNHFSGRITDFDSLITIASSWIIAFIVSAAVAALFFYPMRWWINRSRLHLLEQDLIIRYALVIFGAIAAYFLGANTIANAIGVFVPVTPFKDLTIGSVFSLTGVQQLYLIGALSVVLGIYTYSQKVMGTVGHEIYKLSPATALVALLAETFVLFLFSSRGLQNFLLSIGLPAIPLVPISSTQAMVGAVLGIGLAKGGKNIKYNVLGKVTLAWIVAPLMAFFLAFIALFISQNVFELQVRLPITYTVDKAAVKEIEKQGIDTKNLSFVNLRTFNSERELYKELVQDDFYTHEEAKTIIQICENYPLQVNLELLNKGGLNRRFTAEQLEALSKLDGMKFKRKWNLIQALSEYPAWKLIEPPQSEADKKHNEDLKSDFDILYKVFYLPPNNKI
jgi:PiT family inorganic phosphate transporter